MYVGLSKFRSFVLITGLWGKFLNGFSSLRSLGIHIRVARFFLAHHTKTWKIYKMNKKMYQMFIKLPTFYNPRPPQWTLIGIFGKLICRLATLIPMKTRVSALHSGMFWAGINGHASGPSVYSQLREEMAQLYIYTSMHEQGKTSM
jgi:hypothetical protein